MSRKMKWDRTRKGWGVWETPGKFAPVPSRKPNRKAVRKARRANDRYVALLEAQWDRS